MAAGLGVLNLAPRDFWSMTPIELDAALRGAFGGELTGTHPDRAALDGLIHDYPDIEGS